MIFLNIIRLEKRVIEKKIQMLKSIPLKSLSLYFVLYHFFVLFLFFKCQESNKIC